MLSKLFLSAALAVTAAATPTQTEIDTYPEWAAIMTKEGYDWESHTTKTADGWTLTLFRITGKIEGGEAKSLVTEDVPVLIQHGFGMDARTWAEWGTLEGDPATAVWALQLVDRGYDVWMSSNRGTQYSNVNDRDGSWTDKERWDFSWAEMGRYDQPANISKILAVTGKPKLTYIGYSQGTSQMIYGLAKGHDAFFADRLERVILLAPCIYIDGGDGDEVVQVWYPPYLVGVYSVGGPNHNANKQTVCDRVGAESTACQALSYGFGPEMPESPMKSLVYFS